MSTLDASPENIAIAAERLKAGRLVAMPTETVYGLGADALNASAARRIFEVKGRPPTDPLIVHITDLSMMSVLWDVEPDVRKVADALAARLWPGPLTLVARAAECVPIAVTGSSGFVGLRSPAHAVARALIDASGTCIAAPSANTFGHVSPTTAAHVAADLAPRDPELTILDGGSCGVGIESTVLKLVAGDQVEVLRRGAVSAASIAAALEAAGLAGKVQVTIRDTRTKYASEHAAMDGPGQLLTHYSPNVPSFLVAPGTLPAAAAASPADAGEEATSDAAGGQCPTWAIEGPDGTVIPASDVVVLDFRGDLAGLCRSRSGGGCKASRSLSDSGRADEACHEVFDALRWTETVVGARAVLFPLVTEFRGPPAPGDEDAAALLDAVEDRLFRAASGRIARFVAAPDR